jgi:hypothetical protein
MNATEIIEGAHLVEAWPTHRDVNERIGRIVEIDSTVSDDWSPFREKPLCSGLVLTSE